MSVSGRFSALKRGSCVQHQVRPHRTYTRGVAIAIEREPAVAAMDAFFEGFALTRQLPAAGATLGGLEFAGGRLDESAISFCRFVADHPIERGWRRREDLPIEPGFLGAIGARLRDRAFGRSRPVLDGELLGDDEGVLGDDLSRGLMQKVFSGIRLARLGAPKSRFRGQPLGLARIARPSKSVFDGRGVECVLCARDGGFVLGEDARLAISAYVPSSCARVAKVVTPQSYATAAVCRRRAAEPSAW